MPFKTLLVMVCDRFKTTPYFWSSIEAGATIMKQNSKWSNRMWLDTRFQAHFALCSAQLNLGPVPLADILVAISAYRLGWDLLLRTSSKLPSSCLLKQKRSSWRFVWSSLR